MKFGHDIENEFKEEIESISGNRIIRKKLIYVQFFLLIVIMLSLMFLVVYGKDIPATMSLPLLLVLLVGFPSYFVSEIILNLKYPIKIEAKISELIAYYLFVISSQVKRLDVNKPSTFEKTRKNMNLFFDHIIQYLEDYENIKTHYSDFNFNNIAKDRLKKIQTSLKKINATISNNKIPEKEISIYLMQMAQEMYKSSEFSEEFVEYLDKLLKILEKEKEKEFASTGRNIYSMLKSIPNWSWSMFGFVSVSSIIYFLSPLTTQNKWIAIIMVFVGFLTRYRK